MKCNARKVIHGFHHSPWPCTVQAGSPCTYALDGTSAPCDHVISQSLNLHVSIAILLLIGNHLNQLSSAMCYVLSSPWMCTRLTLCGHVIHKLIIESECMCQFADWEPCDQLSWVVLCAGILACCDTFVSQFLLMITHYTMPSLTWLQYWKWWSCVLNIIELHQFMYWCNPICVRTCSHTNTPSTVTDDHL